MDVMDWFNLIYKIGLIFGGICLLSLLIRNAVRDGIIQAYHRIEESKKNMNNVDDTVQEENVEDKFNK